MAEKNNGHAPEDHFPFGLTPYKEVTDAQPELTSEARVPGPPLNISRYPRRSSLGAALSDKMVSGETYGLDPYTGNVLDGTEDLPMRPAIFEQLQRSIARRSQIVHSDAQVEIPVDTLKKSLSSARSSGSGGSRSQYSEMRRAEEAIYGNMENANTRYTFSWHDIRYGVPIYEESLSRNPFKRKKFSHHRDILLGMNGQARPGELVAILGSSGAGKTTLLNILAGRIMPPKHSTISGKVLINGQKRNVADWKHIAAFVEQQDLLYRTLTVRETMRYAALLKLPKTLSKKAKYQLAEDMMAELGLHGCADTKIGGGDLRGVSGGEKKRVAIGVELITRPKLLFLDEPTSGLDAYTAYSIIETISSLTRNEAKSVIMTIHQPREDILLLCDKVMLLCEGKCIFLGPPQVALDYFQGLGYSCPRYVNPADFFIDLVTMDNRTPESTEESTKRMSFLRDRWDRALESELIRRKDRNRRKSLLEIAENVYEKDKENDGRRRLFSRKPKSSFDRSSTNFWITEMFILLKRSTTAFTKEKMISVGLTVQTIVLFLLVSFTFFQLGFSQPTVQARVGVLFLYVANLLFASIFPILDLFVAERAILVRERYSCTYRMSSFYIAKMISIFPLRIFLALLFTGASYYIIGLNYLASRFFILQLIVLDLVFLAQALGLAIAALSPSSEVPFTRIRLILKV